MSEGQFEKQTDWQTQPEKEKASTNGELKPEGEVFEISQAKHKHYFIRTSATEFGCRDCNNHWIDGGTFLFENGKFIRLK